MPAYRRNCPRTILLVMLALLVSILSAEAGEQDGRSIYTATAPSTFALYALNPDLIAGWNTPLRDYEKKYIPEKYHDIPILGGWYGEGFIPNSEVLLGSGLKKAFYLSSGTHDRLSIVETLERLGFEVVVVPGHYLADIPSSFRAMGQVFGYAERGNQLGDYSETRLNKVKQAFQNMPEEKFVKTYIALGADGLATICQRSDRVEVLQAAGGINIHNCPRGTEESFLHITFEQLLRYDPEVILIYHPALMRKIPDDSKWKQLTAVREGRYYFIPRGPFSWLERPATYMRVLGVQWLANKLHPDIYPVDIRAESKAFFQLFFMIDLSEQQINELFEPYGTF